MLKHHLHLPGSRTDVLFSFLPKPPSPHYSISYWTSAFVASRTLQPIFTTLYEALKIRAPTRRGALSSGQCSARRRSVRYGTDDYEDGEEEEYRHNEEIAMLELYSQSARGEALIVHASVDGEDVEVLIFKYLVNLVTSVDCGVYGKWKQGFSSSLSYGTSPDPTRSILPARAEIKSIDRIKGPFEPSKIEYIEKDLKWEYFKSNFLAN
ncbi:uncharacterized protein LOC116195082 isoform X1 [Punica granatum]|uniref:Uncharacterized protein LOC116195082 isoform X1 n=1 Tax=Punica granatum TaxID=22663 RepID=A0A218Y2E5_PUNGR|nr:uncharacterized protein LOC116195082 isoform X1 [Punica granatum]OWM90722.1 hypothetical protein CDL15_Pgr021027 [Punica granatum]